MTLSKKEKEIINLMVRGFSSKDISSFTNRSKRTIDNQRLNIMKRLDVQNTAELIHKLCKNNLI